MDVRVLVIGAGASGIAAAAELRKAGVDDVVVLEKAAEVGGTWRENTYPGCGCDVPSVWYSFSFAPNPSWSRFYSRQPEILAYLRTTAERQGVLDMIRFGVEVLSAQWDPVSKRWQVETSEGSYRAAVLVAGAGPLHEPVFPEVEGLSSFRGTMFHSARWDHDHDLTGERVAVIGTGASAIQFVPKIQPKVGRLHLFQRTPGWVLPKLDFRIPAAARRLFARVPATERAARTGVYLAHEAAGGAFRHAKVMNVVQRLGLLHLRRQVPDPVLRKALTPEFTLGCKRILLSNTYYRSITQSNVELRPTAVTRIGESFVVGADGVKTEVDTIVFGTGFETGDPPIARRVRDASGRSLAEHWNGSPHAYLGTTVAGFPNLFVFLGPNIVPGHASVLATIEAQARYLTAAVKTMGRNGWSSIDVRREVQDGLNDRIQRALAPTVYNAGGCASYYLSDSGRNIANWPWSVARLYRTIRFDASDYVVSGQRE